MSGGHWDYRHHEIGHVSEDVAKDREVSKRFPKLAKTIAKVGENLGTIIHELDYDLSGDSEIDDDKEYEKKAMSILLNSPLENDPLEKNEIIFKGNQCRVIIDESGVPFLEMDAAIGLELKTWEYSNTSVKLCLPDELVRAIEKGSSNQPKRNQQKRPA